MSMQKSWKFDLLQLLKQIPANLLQAQRDYFGAHTYQRLDQEGAFHTDWLSLRRLPEAAK